MSKELDAKKQLEDLSRRYEELEAKSKADIKVLVKEVKSLRRSHVELEKELTQSLSDKTEAEVIPALYSSIYISLFGSTMGLWVMIMHLSKQERQHN